jgi:hypothetical protein
LVAALTTTSSGPALRAAENAAPRPEAAAELDPAEFFSRVVDRYRDLLHYQDQTRLTQTITGEDERAQTIETEIACRVEGESLKVTTPLRQLRDPLGLRALLASSPALERWRHRYDLWLAPHMALKFLDRPLREFRAGVREGFVASEARSVVVDDRTLVQIKLRSAEPASGAEPAEFDLFVNSRSMLIERIEGDQSLPDGGSLHTRLDITPIEYSSAGEGGGDSQPGAALPAAAPTSPAPAPPVPESAPSGVPAAPRGEAPARPPA